MTARTAGRASASRERGSPTKNQEGPRNQQLPAISQIPAQSLKYKEELIKEIGDYNQRRPQGTLPKADATSLSKGGAFNIPELWQALTAASRNYGKAPDIYYRAYHKYLGAKRGFANDMWKRAYAAYAMSTTEHDAFAVEEQLKIRLKRRGLHLDAGSRTVRMISPVEWSGPSPGLKKPPPPPIPSSGSDLRPS